METNLIFFYVYAFFSPLTYVENQIADWLHSFGLWIW